MPVLAECKPDVIKSKQRVADSYAEYSSARGTPTERQALANYRVTKKIERQFERDLKGKAITSLCQQLEWAVTNHEMG
eukprot:6692980-Pyramimonas_sp.AAC.1